MSDQETYALSIDFTNLKCIPGAELRLGKKKPGEGRLIVVKGDNGVGKSAILDGIKAVVEGGFNPHLITDGKPKFEVRMSLSNGGEIKLVTTRKTYRLDITPPEGEESPIKAPATFVKRMFGSGVSFDPISFCTLKKDERLKYLSSVMPLDFTEAEVNAAMGNATFVFTPVGTLDVVKINKVQNDLKDKRGAVGSKRDEKADSVESWRKLLLKANSDGVDWKTRLATIEGEREKVEKERDAEVKLIEGQIQGVRNDLNGQIRVAEDLAREHFSGILEHARRGDPQMLAAFIILPNRGEAMLSCLATVGELMSRLNTAEYDAQEAIDKARSVAADALGALAGEIATAKTGFESQAKDAGIRSEMEKFRKEVQKLSEDWDSIAEAIKNIELLRRSKLKDLIDGLDIREDGEILVNGREFDNLNTGAQYWKAMELATLGAGESGLLVCDDTIHLGPPQWELFQEAVLASPLTVIATRLSTEEEIEKYGPGLRSEPAAALVLTT